MSGAVTVVVDSHGCKYAGFQQPYFVAVYVLCGGKAALHLPAVVDDFGNLVIVGGPL